MNRAPPVGSAFNIYPHTNGYSDIPSTDGGKDTIR